MTAVAATNAIRTQCVLRGHPADVTCVAFVPSLGTDANGRAYVAAGDMSGVVTIWNLATRRPIAALRHNPQLSADDALNPYRNPSLLSITFLNAATLLTQGRDQTARLWSLGGKGFEQGPEPLVAIRVPLVGFCNVLCAPFSGGNRDDATECAWCLVPDDGERRRLLLHHVTWAVGAPTSATVSEARDVTIATTQKLGMPMAMAYVPASTRTEAVADTALPTLDCVVVAVGYESGHVAVLQLALSPRETLSQGLRLVTRCCVLRAMSDPIVATAISADAELCFVCGATGALQCHQVPLDEEPRTATLRWEDTMPTGASALSLRRSDSRLLALASWDGSVRLYDATHGSRVAVLQGHEGGVAAVAFDVEAPARFITGSSDRSVAVWRCTIGIAEEKNTSEV
jgi:WD40 repeat protein